MLLVFVCLFAAAAAGPLYYDQRQTGDFNAQVDISNLMFVFAIPKKLPQSVFDIFSKSGKPLEGEHDIQDRADVRVMEAFVEPSTPYRVEIGSDKRSQEGDGRNVEVIIAGRRRLEPDLPEAEQDDLKLLGATENCGPARVRDPISLMCKDEEPVVISVSETKIEEKPNQPEQPPKVVS